MKLSSAISVVGAAATSTQASLQKVVDVDAAAGHHVPSSRESAVMGRRILGLTKLATFSTVFPASAPDGSAGLPVGLVDYVADCEDVGNPTVLELEIGTTFRNVQAGSNLTVSLQWVPPYPPAQRMGVSGGGGDGASGVAGLCSSVRSSIMSFFGLGGGHDGPPNSADPSIPDTVPYSADNLPRFALFGYLEPFSAGADAGGRTTEDLERCYLAKHPDSKYWLPGNHIHTSDWARMVVTKVYWIGGFGDRAYIGWIPVEEWNSVTEEEWKAIKLPGETKDWSEWTAYDDDQEL